MVIFGSFWGDFGGMAFLKEALTSIWQGLGLATWLKITTRQPSCTYYFGPFMNQVEAEHHQHAYIQDLEQEGAIGIAVSIERGHTPKMLTEEA